MSYMPRHAMVRAVKSLTPRVRAVVVAAVAAATAGGGFALAGSASAAPLPGTTQIVLDNGGYHYCLNDYGRAITGPVKLYQCNSSDPASNWVFYQDGTIRPALHSGVALSTDSNNNAVLTTVPTGGALDSQKWAYQANGLLANADPMAPPASTGGQYVLNDPGYKAANGVQLVKYHQGGVTSNAHWWPKAARYGTTHLVNGPDAGVKGGYWAIDNGTAYQSLVPVNPSSGSGTEYEGSQVLTGSFITTPTGQQPNATPGHNIGDAVPGTFTSEITSMVSTSKAADTSPSGTGSGLSTRLAPPVPAGFFSGGSSSITQGTLSGFWFYAAKDCAAPTPETTTQTATKVPWGSNGWQYGAPGVFQATGNITAPYPKDFPYPPTGAVSCP